MPTNDGLPDAEKLDWYRRRVAALEQLLAAYRIQGRPSEKLFRELDATRARIDHQGHWRQDPELQYPLPP